MNPLPALPDLAPGNWFVVVFTRQRSSAVDDQDRRARSHQILAVEPRPEASIKRESD